jgi:hypothetical protein
MFAKKRVNRHKQPAVVKLKSIRLWIEQLEDAIRRANDYLETGEHADWHGFRPLFVDKYQDGKRCPPHQDWVRNVFIRRCEQELSRAMKTLRRLELAPARRP